MINKKVSIPYRYSKNYGNPTDKSQTADGFQFLIGILKTSEKWANAYRSQGVSIPYRYSKNAVIIPPLSLLLLVSIPYRYSKNVDHHPVNAYWEEFQFLIGILKTRVTRRLG